MALLWHTWPFGFVAVVGSGVAGFWASAQRAINSERKIKRFMVHLWAITRGIVAPAVLSTTRKNAARPMSV